MKKLMLTMSAVALVALPAAAVAGTSDDSRIDTYTGAAMTTGSAKDMERSYATSPGDDHEQTYTSGTYEVQDGKKLMVKEAVAYLVQPNGSKTFAPTGNYITAKGYRFFVKDGVVTGFLISSRAGMIPADIEPAAGGDDTTTTETSPAPTTTTPGAGNE